MKDHNQNATPETRDVALEARTSEDGTYTIEVSFPPGLTATQRNKIDHVLSAALEKIGYETEWMSDAPRFVAGQQVKVREGYVLYPGTVVGVGRTGLVRVDVDRSSKAFMCSGRKSFRTEDVANLDEMICIVTSADGRSHRIDRTDHPSHHVLARVHPRSGRYVTPCDSGWQLCDSSSILPGQDLVDFLNRN